MRNDSRQPEHETPAMIITLTPINAKPIPSDGSQTAGAPQIQERNLTFGAIFTLAPMAFSAFTLACYYYYCGQEALF